MSEALSPQAQRTPAKSLLSVEDLAVSFPQGDASVEVVTSASFDIDWGEAVGLVGESGSGKTVTSLAIAGLIGIFGGRVTRGRTVFAGRDLAELSKKEWLGIRGSRIAMIFQNPTRCLDPAFTVGDQITESIRRHSRFSRRDAWARAVAGLDRVGIAHAARRAHDYPHMFSGGMCQRVMIAMALACEPELLIADEPTTALDVTVQSKILDLLRDLRDETGVAILYISHDLAVIAEVCDRAAVMYAGQTVEMAAVDELYRRPMHPYTAGLLSSRGRPGPQERFATIPGQVPSPNLMPQGCHFHPRCGHAVNGLCTSKDIALKVVDGRAVRCARAESIVLTGAGL